MQFRSHTVSCHVASHTTKSCKVAIGITPKFTIQRLLGSGSQGITLRGCHLTCLTGKFTQSFSLVVYYLTKWKQFTCLKKCIVNTKKKITICYSVHAQNKRLNILLCRIAKLLGEVIPCVTLLLTPDTLSCYQHAVVVFCIQSAYHSYYY